MNMTDLIEMHVRKSENTQLKKRVSELLRENELFEDMIQKSNALILEDESVLMIIDELMQELIEVTDDEKAVDIATFVQELISNLLCPELEDEIVDLEEKDMDDPWRFRA